MQVTDEMIDAALDAHHSASLAISSDPFEAMRAAITAALAAMWRPMEEAPKDGERLLLGFRGSMSAEGFWHDGSQNHWKQPGWYFADDDLLTGRPCDPDCWQTLPSPPKAEG